MLTTSWAALTEHAVSEQYIGHWGGMQGKHSQLREQAGMCGQREHAEGTKAEPAVGTKAEPTVSTAHALALGTNHSASSLL